MASSRSDSSTGALERFLAYALLVIVIISVGCFFAIMIGTWSGMVQEDFGSGVWPTVAMAPYIGLPLAMLMLIVLLIVGGVRRGRAARGE